MNRFLKFIVIITSTLIFCMRGVAQNGKADSVKALLKIDGEDTAKVKHLNDLAAIVYASKTDTAILLSSQALILAKKINYQLGVGISYHKLGAFYNVQGNYKQALEFYEKALMIWEALANTKNSETDVKYLNRRASTLINIGVIHLYRGDYEKALNFFSRSLKAFEQLKDEDKIALIIGNIGITYHQQGNYAKALEYYFKALNIAERNMDNAAMARHLGNIGAIYHYQEDFSKARDYFLRALKIDKELNDKSALIADLGNIGLVYYNQKNYKEALKYYSNAIVLAEEIGDESGVANNITNMGSVLVEQGEIADSDFKRQELFAKANEYFFKALKIKEKNGEKKEIAVTYATIGKLFLTQKKFREAELYLQKSLAMCEEIGSLLDINRNHESLSELYRATGDHKKSLFHYKKYSVTKDSIYNEEKNKELTRYEMNYEFEKKEAATKAEQDKKDAVTLTEGKKQKAILALVCCVLLLVFIFTGFIFRSLRITKKQKLLIEIKNEETEVQKKIIEEKNKDILDSIHYARRIQIALLPTEKYLERVLEKWDKK